MAEQKATLVLQLKDSATNGMNKLKSGVSKLRLGFVALGAAMGAMVGVGIKAVTAYAKQETAINNMNESLKKSGQFSAESSKDMQNFASQMQKVTTVGDETNLELLSLLGTFGMSTDQMKDSLKATLDLSKGMKVDLKAAALLVGKAFAGETGSLTRYGIVIDQNVPKSEQFAEVLGKINGMVGGRAQAELNTFAGRMENLKNRVGDLVEVAGKQLLPIFEFWAEKAEQIVNLTERMTGAEEIDRQGRELTIETMQRQIEYQKLLLQGTTDHRGALVELSDTERDQVNKRLVQLTKALKKEKEKHNAEINMSKLRQVEKKVEVAAGMAEDEKAAKKREMLIQKLTDKEKNMKAELKLDDAKYQDHLKKLNTQRVNDTFDTLNTISSLASAKTKELAIIGKAAAIASATRDTFVGANKALGQGGFFGFAMAAAVVAAGLANVARISGVALAEGGVVMPTQGGTQATIGEAGKAEAVIPLDDEDAQEKMGGIGGNNITVNIQAFSGDETAIRSLAEEIDKQLFELKRNNQTVSI